MRFILLTLTRLEEVCGLRWRELDPEAATWTIPPERTKNGEPHVLTLSHQARALLLEMPRGGADDLVFSVNGRDRKPAPLSNWDREQKAIHAKSNTSGWHRHDLRRTGSTLLGDMGEMPDIVEAALNHVVIRSPLAATYNRSRYRPQVAAALQRLADALDRIERGSAMIVNIRSVA